MAFTEKYIRIVIAKTTRMWERLAANHLSTN